MATDLVTIATTAVLSQFLGPGAKHLGEVALERGKQLAAKATALLAQVGREPKPVEPKLLLPLVQAASLETDEALVTHWAALLANVADPAQQSLVQLAFIEILRQLTALDARILQAIAAVSQGHEEAMRPHMYAESTRIQREAGEGDALLTTAFRIAVDNLLRLRLCDGRGTTRLPGRLSELIGGRHSDTLAEGPGKDRLAITDLGIAFLQAVAQPTS
jgi:hypothetical protein